MSPRSLLIVVDQWGWAFDRIAQQILIGFRHKYDITIKTAHECILERNPEHYDGLLTLWWGVTADLVRQIGVRRAIFALYDHFTWKGNRIYARRNINASVGLVASNGRLLEEFRGEFPDDKPAWVCEDGVDIKRFTPQPLPDKFTVCWSGNSTTAPNKLKGFHLVDEACRRLDVPLIVADRANGTGISFEKMAGFYSRASVGCYPSLSEGTPNPLLELLACGRCVAITDVGLSDRVIREGRTGAIIKERTVEGVADAIDRLRQVDLDACTKKCLQVGKNYSWDKKIRAWGPVLKHLLTVDQATSKGETTMARPKRKSVRQRRIDRQKPNIAKKAPALSEPKPEKAPVLSESAMEIQELRCRPSPAKLLQVEVEKLEKSRLSLAKDRPLVIVTSPYRFMARTIRLISPLLSWFRFQIVDGASAIPPNADLVWSFYPFQDGLLAARIKAVQKIPFLLTMRGQFWHLNSSVRDMGIKTITEADQVVVLANSLARDLVRRYPQFKTKRIAKIPNGGFPELSLSGATKFHQISGMKKPIIICSTNFNFPEKRKGVDDLVLALDQAGFKGTFAIAASQGPYAPSNGRLGTCGRYIGFVEDRLGMYRAADLFLYMSTMDAQPSVLMEAMSAGLPVVIGRSETSGSEEFVEHRKTGLVFDQPSEGATAALSLLKNRPRAAKLGAAARLSIEEVYTWQKMAIRYRDLIRSMLR